MARPPVPAAPFIPAATAPLAQQVRQLADAMTRKADLTEEPIFSAVLLRAPGGATWRVTVDDTGALNSTVVLR